MYVYTCSVAKIHRTIKRDNVAFSKLKLINTLFRHVLEVDLSVLVVIHDLNQIIQLLLRHCQVALLKTSGSRLVHLCDPDPEL